VFSGQPTKREKEHNNTQRGHGKGDSSKASTKECYSRAIDLMLQMKMKEIISTTKIVNKKHLVLFYFFK